MTNKKNFRDTVLYHKSQSNIQIECEINRFIVGVTKIFVFYCQNVRQLHGAR